MGTSIPHNWASTILEDIVLFALGGDWGKAPEHNETNYVDVRCIRASEIRGWDTDKGATAALRRIKNTSLDARKLIEGDILVEVSGGGPEQPVGRTVLIDKVALTRNPNTPKVCTNFFRLIRPATELNSTYINQYLQYFYRTGKIVDYQGGSNNLRNLKFNDYLGISIPVPPKDEQRRIVSKIEELFSELDKAIENLKIAREQLKVYRQVVLKHAFEGKLTQQWREENKDKLETTEQLLARITKEREARYQLEQSEWKAAVRAWESGGKTGKRPSKPKKAPSEKVEGLPHSGLPNVWVWQSLGNLNVDVFDGPFGSNLKTSDYVDTGVRVIRLENIGYLEFIDDKYSYVTEEKYESIQRHTVHGGDLIFSSFISEGIRLAILPTSIDKAVNKADCFCVRLHGASVRNDYVAHYLSTRNAYKQIESEIHGIGRPRINTTQLKSFFIPLCGREEQDEIMARINAKLSLADNIAMAIDGELERCETLRQSILKRAFSGYLVEQNPGDEPASVLLERIKAEKSAVRKGGKKKKEEEAA